MYGETTEAPGATPASPVQLALKNFLSGVRAVAVNLLTGAEANIPALVGEGVDAAIAVASKQFDIPDLITSAVRAGSHTIEAVADPYIVAGLSLLIARLDGADFGSVPSATADVPKAGA